LQKISSRAVLMTMMLDEKWGIVKGAGPEFCPEI